MHRHLGHRHLAVFALLAACSTAHDPADPADAPPEGVPADKAEAEAQFADGKADWSLDPCDWWGWYGDGACDRFCFQKDPDCLRPISDAPGGLLGRYLIPGDDLFPESVTFDPAQRAFYVGSLSKGNVSRVRADGTYEVVYSGTGEADRVTLGVEVDAARDRLVVCSLLNVDPPTGQVWIFDLATQTQTHDVDLTDAADKGSCNDITIGPDGAIYVTDREQPHVYRVDAPVDGEASVSVWAEDDLLAPPRLGIGQNGLAFTPDGKALLTTQYLPPRLWRIAVDDPSDVREVEMDGRHPLSELLAGADGATFLGDALYVAFGGSLLRARSTDGWYSADYDLLDVDYKVAGVTAAEGSLYVLKSDVAKFLLGGEPDLPFELLRVDPAEFDAK